MQRSPFNIFSPFVVAAVAALTLTGCGGSAPEAESPEEGASPAEPASAGAGVAEISVSDSTYTVELQHCVLSDGDALFHGPAFDDSGSPVGYFDGDFGDLTNQPYGEARIDFGATEQFESSDEFIAMGDSFGHLVVTDASDTNVIIVGGLRDQDGTQVGTGSLRVEC